MSTGGRVSVAGNDSDDSIHDDSLDWGSCFPPSSGTVKGGSPPPSPSPPKRRRTAEHSAQALLPPPRQSGRTASSSSSSRGRLRGNEGFAIASTSSIPSLLPTAAQPQSQLRCSTRSSTSASLSSSSRRSSRPSTSTSTSTATASLSLPIGVPRPPTTRRAPAPQRSTFALRETQPQSQESSQEDSVSSLPEPSLQKEREREELQRRRREMGKAKEEQLGELSRKKSAERSTTPTFSPPPLSPSTSTATSLSSLASAFLLPPPSFSGAIPNPSLSTTQSGHSRDRSSRCTSSRPASSRSAAPAAKRSRGTTPTFSPPPDLPPPSYASVHAAASSALPSIHSSTILPAGTKREARSLHPVPIMAPSSFRPKAASPLPPPSRPVSSTSSATVVVMEDKREDAAQTGGEKEEEPRALTNRAGSQKKVRQRVVIGSDWRQWKIKKRSRAVSEEDDDDLNERYVQIASPILPLPSPSPLPQPVQTPPSLPLTPLRLLDPQLCDPHSLYSLSSSLLFRLEYLPPSESHPEGLGAPTRQQGAKKAGYGAKGIANLGTKKKESGRESIPSWAKTQEEEEWDEPLLALLSRRLYSAPTTTPALSQFEGKKIKEVEDFAAVLWARDVPKLRLVRLGGEGGGGGVECYLVSSSSTVAVKGAGGGRGCKGKGAEVKGEHKNSGEFPCKSVVVVGWVCSREWKENQRGGEYVVDDGTGLIEVFCPSTESPPSDSFFGGSSTSTFTNPPSFLPLSSTTPKLSPRRAIAARHALLESRADARSEKLVVDVGRLVRVVGRVEEPGWVKEGAKEGEGRRIRAVRMDVIPPHLALSTESTHHKVVHALHRELYSAPSFDLKGALQRIEQREERQRREKSIMSDASSGANSSYAQGSTADSSVGGSSPGRRRLRPPRPSKLAPEDLTLSNFIIYIRFHLQDKFVKSTSNSSASDRTSFADVLASPSPTPSPSSFNAPFDPFAPTDSPPTFASASTEVSIPFSLSTLQTSSSHLQLFARRLAQRLARAKLDKEQGDRARKKRLGAAGVVLGGRPRLRNAIGVAEAYVAPGRTGVGKAKRGMVEKGSGAFLLPSSAQASHSTSTCDDEQIEARRARRRAEKALMRGEDGPLHGAELEKAVGKVWRDALRTMRGNGVVVEYVAPPQEEEVVEEVEVEGGWGGAGLPDEPSWAKRVKREVKEESVCPWGDPFAEIDLEGGETPTTPKATRAPAIKQEEVEDAVSACPWGDVKLEWDESSPKKEVKVEEEEDAVVKTPTAQRISPHHPRRSSHSSNSKTPRPAAAAFPSPLALPSSSAARHGAGMGMDTSLRSESSYMTTGSLNYSLTTSPTSPSLPHFQLVTSRTLAPVVLSLLSALYSTGKGNVEVLDIRKRMACDDTWEKVAAYSPEVDRAMEVLEEMGEAEKCGKGWRPVRRGGRW
ncbi:hypothetical protein JCM11251_003655 [Rhodosporidiobolus azoricus]